MRSGILASVSGWTIRSCGPALGRFGLIAASMLGVLLGVAEAREVSIRGAEMNRFGRLVLEFDAPTKVSARAANGVLIIGFADPATIKAERLPAEMPAYVSTVRHDPDRSGLRLALTASYRVNVLEAGERVFIDLVPENWTGLLPALPPDVVADLARRAQEAEARLKAEAIRRETEAAKPITARVAILPNLMRLVFEPPGFVPVEFAQKGRDVTLSFSGAYTLDRSQIGGQLAPGVKALAVEEGRELLQVRLTLAPGFDARGFREDEAFVIDIAKPAAAGSAPVPPAAPLLPAMPARSAPPVRPTPEPAPVPAASAEAPKPAPPAAGPVQPKTSVSAEGLRIAFPFAGRVAAAAFERGGLVTILFHTQEPLALAALPPEAAPHAALSDVVREGAFVRVRLRLAKPQLTRLSPLDRGWLLSIGDEQVATSQPLPLRRSVDDAGRTVVAVPLADSSGVHWIEDGSGERIAVVTAFGTPRGSPKAQRFVDFALLPTVQGLAVSALADDLVVRSGIDEVTISRGSGLSVSLPNADGEGTIAAAKAEPVIGRDPWLQAQRGNVLEKARELLRAAAEAPRSQRAETRMKIAQLYLANGLAPEAESVLAYAVQEEPALSGQRSASLLRGIALLRSGRLAEARMVLAAPVLGEDPEGILWRAALDAAQKRWAPALAGFRRSANTLDGYPEDVQAGLRIQAAQAALAMRDFVHADREFTAAAPLLSGEARSRMLLLRARLDEALGRPEIALEAYQRLAGSAERPVSAEATLAAVELGLQQASMNAAEAIPRLETLSVIWRGGDVEVATLGRLGRLYAEAGRWREAFLTARRANQIFPDHETTRALHEETARLFEDLFLSGKGDTLSRVDSLALYFDFKEFTPIGRRGDEIVRRLADRLVELDLLDQAGALLQHQVDNRLFGAARATVAARLATVRLMDGKPALALQALRATRLPELPQDINRARLLLEARALSDLSRTDLALEVLQSETGPEIDRLRADILWSGRRWRDAGEAHEKILGLRWQGASALSDQDRSDVLRAAIAYTLADDALSLDRVRAKFAGKMADSGDARTFAFITQPNAASTGAFRDLARRVTSTDTLVDFLEEYRKRYPDAAAAARPKATAAPPRS